MEPSLGLKVLVLTWLFPLPQFGMPVPLEQEQRAEIRASLALHSIQPEAAQLQANWELVTATALVVLSHSTNTCQAPVPRSGGRRKARLLASRSLQYSRNAGIVSVGDLQRIQQEQVVILMVRRA